jgi:hypothetical protein
VTRVHILGLSQRLALQPSGHQGEFPAAVDCRPVFFREFSIISHLCYMVRACIVHCCTCHLLERFARGRNTPGPGFPSSAPRFPHQFDVRALAVLSSQLTSLRRPETIEVRPEEIQLSLLLTLPLSPLLPLLLFCFLRSISCINPASFPRQLLV